jgi:zinc protease
MQYSRGAILFLLTLFWVCSACTVQSQPPPAPQPEKEQQSHQSITVSVTVPDLAWRVQIEEIAVVGNEVWVVSRVDRAASMAGQVITTVRDTVNVIAPALPLKHFILGKTWHWQNPEPYVFVQDKSEIAVQLQQGRQLFQR